MIGSDQGYLRYIFRRRIIEIGVSAALGLIYGLLIGFNPYLPLPTDWQKLVLILPFGLAIVMLSKNLEKLILAAIAISIPLNLDFSLIISPYARNPENVAAGNRTIVALTELRISFVLIVVLIGYVLWLVDRHNGGLRRIRFYPATSIPALGFIFIYLLSIFQAQDVQLSFFKIVQSVELFMVYFYLVNHIRTRQDFEFFLAIFIGGMLAEGLLMIVQWLTGLSFSFVGIESYLYGKTGRTTGTLGTANVAAGVMATQLAIVSAMIWLYTRRLQKFITLVCFGVGCVALISTGGRGAWGSYVVALLIIVFMGWWRGWVQSKSLAWLFILSLVIGAVLFPTIYARLTANDNGSAESRLKMDRLAWNVITASPLHFFFGVGTNNYALIAPTYNTADVGYLGYVIDSSVHNAYLLEWSETGLIGLFIFISFLAFPLRKVWTHIKSSNRYFSLIAIGLGSALIAYSIQMLADPGVLRQTKLLLWLLVSMVASLDNLETKQNDTFVTSQVDA